MTAHFSIKSNIVHLWKAFLPDFMQKEAYFASFLSESELERAHRFIQKIHSTRFILTRGILRKILSDYLNISPVKIDFEYGEHGKPYVVDRSLQFNVSHSLDVALFAITKKHEVGVDIEKIEDKYKEGIAKRFFREEENIELESLPEGERNAAFYQIWAKKEAVIKMLGKGLYSPLDSFTVSAKNKSETLLNGIYVESITMFSGYASAFAVGERIEEIKVFDCSKCRVD